MKKEICPFTKELFNKLNDDYQTGIDSEYIQDGDAVYNVKITRHKDGTGKAWLKNVDTQQEITLERRPKM